MKRGSPRPTNGAAGGAGPVEEAVRLAEQASLEESGRLVGRLTARLGGTNDDGTPKVFRDSAVENLDT